MKTFEKERDYALEKYPYLTEKEAREEWEQFKGQSLFGVLMGTIIVLVVLYTYFFHNQRINLFYYALGGLGIVLILLGAIIPDLLFYPCKFFKFIGDKIGKAILSVFLFLLYIILIIPVGLILCTKKSAYGFYKWDDKKPFSNLLTSFHSVPKEKCSISKNKRSNFLVNYLSAFVAGKHFYLIPVSIIIIVLAVLFFYVSSSSIAFFVYTLF